MSLAKLLIVDDEAAHTKALCGTLESEGYLTTGFTSPRDALEALRQQPFDLILTDLMMPELDGISLLKLALEIDPNLVGIVMTGHSTVSSAVEALRTGALDYIQKPFRLSAVLPVLARARHMRELRMENIQLREAVVLSELNVSVAFATDFDSVLIKLADAIEQFQARDLSILLPAGDDSDFYVAMARGESGDGLMNKRVAIPGSLTNWVDHCRELMSTPEQLSTIQSLAPPIPKLPAGFSVPMVAGGRLVGILHFTPAHSERSITVGQAKALSILANAGASALEGASLLERLTSAEQRYRQLAENAPDVVIRYEVYPKAGFSYVNPAITTLTGYTPEDYYQDPELALRIVHPEDRSILETVLGGRHPSGTSATMRFVRKSGEVVWVEQRSVAVYHGGRLAAIEAIARDITERKALEERLNHSQKLEAIGQLTAGVAHDFNNLLTVINGYSDLALKEMGEKSPSRHKIEEVRKAGDQAAALTRQLLAFSRRQVLQPRAMDLSAILTEMTPMIHRVAGETVQVKISPCEALRSVKIDPGQVQQVILNLAVNAKDAMADGGVLAFELRNGVPDEAQAAGQGLGTGPCVSLTVRDTGCGMPADVKARAFEPFFTTKELGRGTGLGLATVYGIVQQSGGHIWVESEPGAGTTFTMVFPAVDDLPQSAAPADTPHLTRGTETILVVEDNSSVRMLVEGILSSAGYHLLMAESGETALDAVAGHPGKIHLLLSDVMLPRQTGQQVADQLRALRPDLQVLLMSGYVGNAIGQNGTLDSGIEFIQKPFTPEKLCARVRQVLHPPSSVRRILVADDEPAIRSLLAEILESSGFGVITAKDGKDAIESAARNPVDLVIMDLAMPEMEGIELLAALRKNHPEAKLVAMSGAFGTDILKAARLLGAHATLHKPLTAESVLDCIRSL